jgi:hypothetical protein
LHCTADAIVVKPPGLPDGIFSNQKSQFLYIFEGLGEQNFGKLYVRWVHFMAIWYMYC